jgi:hypothetical protein
VLICTSWYLPRVQALAGTPPIDTAQFWRQPFRVPASRDPQVATAQTIDIMCQHVAHAANDDGVQQAAAGAARQFTSLSAAGRPNNAALAAACWWWAKLYIKFVHHETLLRQFLGEAGHLQGLISPEILVRMSRPEGDCAIYSMCIAAFLCTLGVPFEIVTVACNPREPDIFSHVYLYAVLEDGSRLPLDASHGDYPGWQVPSNRVTKRQVWDASGNRISDRGSRFDGLHGYSLRGMGDICVASDPDYDPAACASMASSGLPPTVACTCVNGTCREDGNSCSSLYATPTGTPYVGPTYTAPSQSSSQWAAFASQALKDGFTLAQINAIQPGTVVGTNGQILRQTAGFSVPVGPGAGVTSAFSGMSSTTLLLFAALGLGAFALMGSRR